MTEFWKWMHEQGGCSYERAKQGIIVVMEILSISILVMDTQNFTCNNTAQN